MAYVTQSGEIRESQPWGLAKLIGLFWSFLNFFVMFFQTLISPGSNSRDGASFSRGSGGGGGGGPHHVTGERDLAAKLKEAGRKLVVIDFFATWCGPCKMIGPHIDEMAMEMPEVMFLKVDVDECYNIASKYEIRSMPTIVFMKNDNKLESFSGADVQRIRDTIHKYR